jgi:hypothetical protein
LDTAFTLPGKPWPSSYRLLLDTGCERPPQIDTTVPSGSAIALTAFSVQILSAAG